MESRFGRDFGDVRVHDGADADAAATALRARAFTIGRDVFFAHGEYDASGAGKRRLLAHELTHVVQQDFGRQDRRVQRQGVDVDEDMDDGEEESVPPPVAEPLVDALQVIQLYGSGANGLSRDLVEGIERAEQRFLTRLRWLSEFLGLGSSRGPTQLKEGAIAQVEQMMPSAVRAFAALYGPAPAEWTEKATHPAWYLFYTAGYAAFSLNEAVRTYQANDTAEGLVNLGIVVYVGAFTSIRDLRRDIASAQQIARTDVTWDMIESDLRVTTDPHLNDIVNYVRTVNGQSDIPFIPAAERP